MIYEKGDKLQSGKAKLLYTVKNQAHLVWMEFKDSLTAFNGSKQAVFSGKGELNRNLSSCIFRYLGTKGIQHHWKQNIEACSAVCLQAQMIPLEVVVRNRLAGSTAKRFQVREGKILSAPLVELYYKDDALGDPFVSTEQVAALKLISNIKWVPSLQKMSYQINQELKYFFHVVGLELIDFKLEFGVFSNSIILGDEISCDTCRLWDKESGKKMDKDVFRFNLGNVQKVYQAVYNRVIAKWDVK